MGRVEIPAFGKGRIPYGAGVAFGEDETVAVRPAGVLRVDAHDSEIKRRHDVGCRKGAAGVPRVGGGDHLDDVAADGSRHVLEFRDGHRV